MRDGVWNHQPHDCLLNRLFRRRSKKTSKLRVTSLCVGISPGTGEFLAQMASNAVYVTIWWRHHVLLHWSDYSFSLSRWYSPLDIGLCDRKLILSFVSKVAVVIPAKDKFILEWRHNECDGVSTHQPYDYFLSRLFVRRLKKTSKLRVTGLCCKGSVTKKIFPFDDVIMRPGDVLSMNG